MNDLSVLVCTWTERGWRGGSFFFHIITEDLLWHLHHRGHIVIVRDEGKDLVDPCRIENASADESTNTVERN